MVMKHNVALLNIFEINPKIVKKLNIECGINEFCHRIPDKNKCLLLHKQCIKGTLLNYMVAFQNF